MEVKRWRKQGGGGECGRAGASCLGAPLADLGPVAFRCGASSAVCATGASLRLESVKSLATLDDRPKDWVFASASHRFVDTRTHGEASFADAQLSMPSLYSPLAIKTRTGVVRSPTNDFSSSKRTAVTSA